MTTMLDTILGYNHVYIGYFGLVFAAIGLVLCTFFVIPQALHQMKRDSIFNTRLILLTLPTIIVFMFANALWITFSRLILDGTVGTSQSNNARFFYGCGVGFLGILLFILFKYGGEMERAITKARHEEAAEHEHDST